MDYHKPAELGRLLRERFIQGRTREETKFNNWKGALLQCSKELILDKIPFDVANSTLQTFVPEWYVEKPNEEIAKQQVMELNNKITIVNNIVEEYNMKGIALLKEYEDLNK